MAYAVGIALALATGGFGRSDYVLFGVMDGILIREGLRVSGVDRARRGEND